VDYVYFVFVSIREFDLFTFLNFRASVSSIMATAGLKNYISLHKENSLLRAAKKVNHYLLSKNKSACSGSNFLVN
jgi:hypothetical protein